MTREQVYVTSPNGDKRVLLEPYERRDNEAATAVHVWIGAHHFELLPGDVVTFESKKES